MPRFNGTETIIDIAANTGITPILATGPVRYLRITESLLILAGAANVPQGIEYQLVSKNIDGTVALGPWILLQPSNDGESPVSQPVEVGDPMSLRSPYGSCIGNGPQTLGQGLPATPASTLVNVRSATGTATSVVVRQDY